MKKLNVLLVIYDNASPISYFPLGAAYIASAIRDAGHCVQIYNQDVYHYSEEHLATSKYPATGQRLHKKSSLKPQPCKKPEYS